MKGSKLGWTLAVTAMLAVTSIVTAQIAGDSWRAAAGLPKGKDGKVVQVKTQSKNNRELLIKYRLPDPVTNELLESSGGKLTQIQLGNTPLRGKKGEPVLPVIPVQFVIPYGCEIASIEINNEKKTSLTLTSSIAYGSTPIPLMKGAKAEKSVPKASIYESDRGFPDKNNDLVSVQNKRGVKIGVVNIHPVTYFPKANKIEICKEFDIKITFKDVKKSSWKPLRLRSTKNELQKLGVENPEMLQQYQDSSNKNTVPQSLNRQMLDASETFQYVVITSEAIRDASTDVTINNLITYRQSLGLTAKLVTMESILATYTGVDNAEKVRNFIIDAYTNWETEYVLLAGDVNIIPIRDLYTDGTYIHSDFYYQCLDGTFNSDGDSYWGEPNDGEDGGDIDLFAEIKVGRISAENPQEMSNAVFKILAYERDNESEEYLRTSCMVGEELGSNFGSGEFGFAHPYMNEIKNGSSASGYTTAGFRANAALNIDSLDDFDAYWPAESLINIINSNKYSVLNHLGHANTDYVMKMYNNQADNLKNTKFMFVFSQGCFPGDLTGDCIAEHLTTSTRTGLFAGVFNSNYGYGAFNTDYETLDGPSQRINRQFWDAYLSEYIFNLGAINADSHEDNVWDINGDLIRWSIYETNLFGDPYTVLRGQTQGPKIVFKSSIVNDKQNGNGDKIINPGEQVAIGLSLQNIGNGIASGVSASIAISDPYISVVSKNLSFGNMPCCGVVVASNNYATIAVDSSIPTPYKFPMTLEINDNAGSSWVETFNLVVHTTYTISGRVVTITGSNPLSGAVIKVTGAVNGETTTDANGQYRFPAVEGEYSVHAEAAEYLNSKTITVTLPPNAKNIDFQMGRSQMVIDPVAIRRTLQVNDSVTIPMQIKNTGDVDLLVNAQCKSVSVALGKRAPRLIPGDTAHQIIKTYIDNSSNKEVKKITPPKLVTGKKVPFGNTQKVLYLNTILYDNNPDQFIKSLTGLANVEKVDLLFGSNVTPDLTYLLQYDVVVVASSDIWSDNVLLGNTLADYVDAGGSLCLLVASFTNIEDMGLKGRIITPEYLPLQMGGAGDYSSATTFISHSITKGVTSLVTNIPIATTTLQGNGVALGTYSTGYLVGAYNRTKPVVVINVFPFDYYWGGDLITLMGNTIDWFSECKWANISPANEQLVVTPGSSTEINVTLKSVNLFGGLYSGAIELVHNDPHQNNPLIVPIELTIDGFKSLTVGPKSISFGNLWLGLNDTAKLTLTNSGTQKTVVEAITSDNNQFSVNAQLPLSIPAGSTAMVNMVYEPVALGQSSATFSVASDAEDNPSILIGASANCTAGPKAILDPITINFNLGPKDNPADQTAVLSNKGGDILSYHTLIRQKSKPAFDTVAKSTHAKACSMENLIYSPYNYQHEFALDRVIVALNEGKTDLANKALLTSLASGNVRELAVARVPKKGIRAYTGKKLILIPLANNSRNGVLDAIKLLRQDINVAYAEPDYRVKAIGVPNDPLFSKQYALNNSGQTGGTVDADIDAVEGWDVFTGENSDIILAIIDTGIDYLQPDLAGNIWTNKGEIPGNGIDDDLNGYVDDVYGYDFAYDDNNPMDVHGHGTHCSGIAAARGNDRTGVCGVSHGARLMATKFLDDGGSGNSSDAIDALAYAYAMGATISSNSWGGGAYEQSLYDMIAATGVFIAAAGNNGIDADIFPQYPAGYDLDNIISVAATDHNDKLADFSNYGVTTVDIGAPGVDILSCLPDNNHAAWSGTSMAAPQVSGCAVLLKTYNPILTSAELKAALLNGVDKIPALEGKTVTGGRLNVKKALESVSPPWLTINPSVAGILQIGAEQQYSITANPQGLVAGTWVAEVVFKTDDPSKNDHIITVTANVSPCRQLESAAEALNFGTVWVSRDTVLNLMLINNCNAPVTVSSCAFNNKSFSSAQIVPFKVAPFSTFNLPIKYTPAASGYNDGTIVLTSDAEDNPKLTIPVHGKAVTPPNISVNPVSIYKNLAYGTTQSVPVTLTNSGGADYLYKVKPANPPKSRSAKGKLSLSDAKVFVSLLGDTIRQLNIETGEFIGKPIMKPYHAYADEGMAYDGEFIYYTNASSAIMVIDPASGKVVDTVNCNTGKSYIDGIGVTDDYLVLGDRGYQKVNVCNKKTGALVASWNSNGYSGGIGCSQSRQSVFITNSYLGQIEERSLLDGVQLNVIAAQTYQLFGIGYSEAANLLIASDPYQGVTALNPDNGDFVASYPIPNIFAVAADEGNGNLKWLHVDSDEGVVPAGGSVTFNALLNSTNILPGPYTANLQVQHRLPILPGPYDISCNMTVLEEKRCTASLSSMTFTQTWVGRTDTLQTCLVNSGNAPTTVKSIVSSNQLFKSFISGPITIPAFDSVRVLVGFTPKKTGTASGNLTITSDAVKSPVIKVTLQGTSLNPPKISCSPNSFKRTLLPGKTLQEIINLKNTGGAAYPFNVTIESVDGSGASGRGQLFGLNHKGLFEMDPITGAILSVRSPMPMNGPATFDGTYLYLLHNYTDTIEVIDPNNGTVVRKMIVENDSIDGKASDITVSGNYLLLKGSAKDGLTVRVLDKKTGNILKSWGTGWNYTGFCSGKEPGTCYMYSYVSRSLETRSIEDGRVISSVPMSLENGYILTYSGSLDALYSSNGTDHVLLNPSTGVIIARFTTVDYMQLEADEAPSLSWLKSTITSGSVPSKGTFNVPLTFNSTKLLPGTYKANVVIEHPQAWQPGPFTIPCELTVLPFSKLTIVPEKLDFGKVWVGKDSLSALTLQNSGNVKVTVYSVVHLNKSFTTDPTPITVPPFSSVILKTHFTPEKTGSFKNTSIIVSNALDLPVKTVSMTGIGVTPPVVAVSPQQFNIQVPAGSSSAQILSLQNSGGADYTFKIGANNTTAKTASGTLFVANGNQIIKIDPSTFEPIDDPITPLPDLWTGGLAYDGKYLYLSENNDKKSMNFYVVDPQSPSVIDTLKTDLGYIWCTGLGVTDEYILALDSRLRLLYCIDKKSGKTVSVFKIDGTGALTAASGRGSLFVFNSSSWAIEERSLKDGSLINQIAYPDSSSPPSGAGYSNTQNILFVGNLAGNIRGFNPDNGEIVSSVNTKFTNLSGLAADEASVKVQWLNTSIKNGVVPAGGKLDIEVLFDAKGLAPGAFTGGINVTPVEAGAPGPFIIPCNLSVSEGEIAKKD